jgi:manganese/zinc/iron transport system permease protein
MTEPWLNFLSFDMPALMAACSAAISCALLGNFLVLRKVSLLGDAISHAVFPGIVLAFLFFGARSGIGIFVGAALAGVLSVMLIELVRKLGRVDPGASMGVVFSLFFAVGVILMEQASASTVDLDTDCVLHGQLENVFWLLPADVSWSSIATSFYLLPSEVLRSLIVLILTIAFVCLLKKELTIAAFNPELATTLGFNANFLHYVLVIFVALTVVASFEVVGSILVIAMLICPAAAARLMTDRLGVQLWASVVFAFVSAVLGYYSASVLPSYFGLGNSFNAAGCMSVMSGCVLGASLVLAPRYGVCARYYRSLYLSVSVRRDDILGFLYRAEEIQGYSGFSLHSVSEAFGRNVTTAIAFLSACLRKQVVYLNGVASLTSLGRDEARSLVRTHRLWETYLVENLGLRTDHVHTTAMELEHFTPKEMEKRLADTVSNPSEDPHGSPIPSENDE